MTKKFQARKPAWNTKILSFVENESEGISET
jgi:hypothetical protein